MIGMTEAHGIKELVWIRCRADVFVSQTREDDFPTRHLETLACGTPVVACDRDGSTESIDASRGSVHRRVDLIGLASAIEAVRKRKDGVLNTLSGSSAGKSRSAPDGVKVL